MANIETKIPPQFQDEGLDIEDFLMIKEIALGDLHECWEHPSTYAGSSIKPNPDFMQYAENLTRQGWLRRNDNGTYSSTSKALQFFDK